MKLKIGKKSGLRYFSYDDIQSWKPCYDPAKYIPITWHGTAVDVLDMKEVPVEDRFWVIVRSEIISERTMRLFAVWCARQVQHLMTDQRSLDALDVAERYAHGKATKEELDAARAAAWAAAGAAARDEEWAAARAAAWDAAWDAACAAQVAKLREMVIAEALERKGGGK